MLIPFRTLMKKYNLKIKGIIHVGAHMCEELHDYCREGVPEDKIIWIEGNPKIVQKQPNIKNLYQALIFDEEKEMDFMITNNGASSSLLELDEHKIEHPHIHEVDRIKLPTITLENFLIKNNIEIDFNFINLDLQGTELNALKSLGERINKVDYIYTEVNKKHLYKDCNLIDELTSFLESHGFRLVDLSMTQHGWGDAFYMRT